MDDDFKIGLRPDPELSVTEWSNKYRVLPKKSSSEPGKYRSHRTPYVHEIMNCLSPSSTVPEVCIMKATQLGFTTIGENWFYYVVDVAPGPFMMVLPTVELAKDHSKQKLAPAIQEMPRLRGKIRDNRSRDSGNTIQVKEFPGGILFLSGSNSGSFFRQRSIRYLFLDDIDGFEMDVGGEGDPCELARKRTDTYSSRKKIFEVSTPTVKGISRIEKSFEESDQRYYFVSCPHCGGMQRLEFGGEGRECGLKFTRDEHENVTDVWYKCAYCHERIDEYHKTDMLEQGEWRPTYPEREKRGYQLSSLYSPLGWVSWKQIVQEFLKAKDNRERLKVWTNTRLGLPFEEKGEQPDWVSLSTRAEPYEMLTVPAGGLLLTAGVDIQENRIAMVIRAWGRGEENWLVYWGELYGNPAETPGIWAELDSLLNRTYPHELGAELSIISMAIDAGYHTQTVYNYCRKRSPKVIAVKGQAVSGKPVIGRPSQQDITWQGVKIPNGVQLWPVGSDTAKATIYARLEQSKPGPGYYHFFMGTDEEYFQQLTAEKQITKYVKGYPKLEWVKVGPRNEALDCEVYAYAAAIRAGLARMDWNSLEKLVMGEKQDDRSAPKPEKPLVPRQGHWLDRSMRQSWIRR